MEFNIEASKAGARLRRGVHTHTLSIGDHDTTAMINGTDAQLQRLAFDILTATGITVEQVNQLAPSAFAAAPQIANSLVERISLRAQEFGGVTAGSATPIVRIYFSEDLQRGGYNGWSVSVEIKPPRKPNRFACAKARSLDQALRRLAKEVGL